MRLLSARCEVCGLLSARERCGGAVEGRERCRCGLLSARDEGVSYCQQERCGRRKGVRVHLMVVEREDIVSKRCSGGKRQQEEGS